MRRNSRVSQKEQVEHRVVSAEVDQRPAKHPAAHGQQAEPNCDQEHVAKQRSAAAVRHLQETDRQSAKAVRQAATAAPSPLMFELLPQLCRCTRL